MSTLPSWSKLFIAVGTYDGALAGWELKNEESVTSKKEKNDNKLTLTFATACHDGSVRSLCFASPISASNHDDSADTTSTMTTPSSSNIILPGALLSCGFDELLRTHDWSKRKTGLGEVRTPSDFGTPLCTSFAPPPPLPLLASSSTGGNSTHALVGFSQGKIVIYKKRDWSVQHVLAGHDGGVSSLAVHPSGKLALSGGQADGKLKLWDLTKGRLAYATQVVVAPTSSVTKPQAQKRRAIMPAVHSLVWSPDGTAYGFCHGTHITVRDVDTGKDLLDVDDLPSRVNQIALLSVTEGLFVAAACDDGSLPVLAVQLADDASNDNPEEEAVRRAIMAIEPVDATVAGEERFKCIQVVSDYHVVTANSAGVVSLMSLQGAIQMIMKPEEDDGDDEDADADADDESVERERRDKEDEDEELAVEILDSVQLGQGARITCLAVWAEPNVVPAEEDVENETSLPAVKEAKEDASPNKKDKKKNKKKLLKGAAEHQGALGDKRQRPNSNIDMDSATIKKARELVNQAKELQKKRDRKRRKAGNKK